MKKGLVVSIAAVFGVMMLAPSVMAGTLVEFKGGIGVDPVSTVARNPGGSATGNAVRNDVRGVQPGALPWVIRKFKAEVKDDGDIKAKGKGMSLAGGEATGTRGVVLTVQATLFCGAAAPPPASTAHSSDPVPLELDGDFKIKDTLDPLPPDPCDNPVLLIRVVELAEPPFFPPRPGLPLASLKMTTMMMTMTRLHRFPSKRWR